MSTPLERFLPASVVVLGVLMAGIAVALVVGEPEPAPAPPLQAKAEVRLVVLVVFDQLRADLIVRPDWREHFGPDGFRRLQEDGAWFTECHYPYAVTATGPGHAAMLSGAPPSVTGIINNEWYDRKEKSEAYCAGNIKYSIIPPPPVEPTASTTDKKPKQVGTPTRMLAPTVADVLKRHTREQGKVFGLSLKDRSGILPSGERPDGVFWFDGRFVTSTYYADAVPKWATEFNASGKAESYFGEDWVRVKPELDYDKLAGSDKQEGEGTGAGQGGEFPHPMNGGKDKEGKTFTSAKAAGTKYYESLANSPFGNELLLEFAKACIDAERLGADDEPDLLTVSFSSNDLIGHTWGPDSHEVLDCTLRSDAILAGLLKHLDEKVGKGKYAVVLTADHGICPLPEFAAKHPERYPDAKDAKRVSGKELQATAESHLREQFGKPTDNDDEKVTALRWIEKVSPPYFYLNHKLAKDRGMSVEKMTDSLAGWLEKQNGVQRAFVTRELLTLEIEKTDRIAKAVQLAYHPDRSGDVYVVLKPYHLIEIPTSTNKLPSGTNHGSPNTYDQHVPLLVFGPGVKGGKRSEQVTPLHAAPIAAKFLGVPPPAKAMYPLPKTLAE